MTRCFWILFLLSIVESFHLPIIISPDGCNARPLGANLWMVFSDLTAFYEFTSYWLCFHNDIVTHDRCFDLDLVFNSRLTSLNASSWKHCDPWMPTAPNVVYLHCLCGTFPSCQTMSSYVFLTFHQSNDPFDPFRALPIVEKCQYCDGKHCVIEKGQIIPSH